MRPVSGAGGGIFPLHLPAERGAASTGGIWRACTSTQLEAADRERGVGVGGDPEIKIDCRCTEEVRDYT